MFPVMFQVFQMLQTSEDRNGSEQLSFHNKKFTSALVQRIKTVASYLVSPPPLLNSKGMPWPHRHYERAATWTSICTVTTLSYCTHSPQTSITHLLHPETWGIPLLKSAWS